MNKYIDDLIKLALLEDIGSGDITTDLIFSQATDLFTTATVTAKEDLILSGLIPFERTFDLLADDFEFQVQAKDGDSLKTGDKIISVNGNISNLLKGERVALNFIQKLSGIATLTNKYIKKIGSAKTKILDTRKTTPAFRMLEKKAVSDGGGFNHRYNLASGIMIKDNHIKAAGSILKAVDLVRAGDNMSMKIEVETKTLEQVEEACLAKADIIMLDNMSPKLIKKALKIINKSCEVEISGGIGFDNILDYINLGADYISVGALTHHATSVDISMNIE
ncbi:MAG: carboxylating nicotinate-nucleotide diphosphorylase [Pseudomonadota bacterium]